MSDKTRLGLATLAVGAGLGVAGDALLHTWPWGLNVGLWVALLACAAVGLARWGRVALAGGGRWLLIPAALFAAACAWRASETLGMLNLLATLSALALAAAYSRAGRVVVAGWTDYAQAAVLAGVQASLGPLLVALSDVSWGQIPRHGWLPRALAVGRGLAIALPIVLVFGGLFAAADAVFGAVVANILRIDFRDVFAHTIIFAILAWLCVGFLRDSLGERVWLENAVPSPRVLSLGATELAIVLGALDALFAAFVVIQARYLFGGASLVETSATLSYSEYARRGFFELVTVAALLLPLLLAIDWLRQRDRPSQVRLFQVLAGLLVVLLFLVMASAVQRMRLYTEEFGLTELRVYTTAFMGWLGLVFLWFLVTVLRGRRERFAFGAMVGAFAVLLALNALNPDDLIVRVNASRPQAPRPFDGRYAASLSADAVPALVESFALVPERERKEVAQRLLRWMPPTREDWRSWNWGRQNAREAVARQEAELRAASNR